MTQGRSFNVWTFSVPFQEPRAIFREEGLYGRSPEQARRPQRRGSSGPDDLMSLFNGEGYKMLSLILWLPGTGTSNCNQLSDTGQLPQSTWDVYKNGRGNQKNDLKKNEITHLKVIRSLSRARIDWARFMDFTLTACLQFRGRSDEIQRNS